MEYKEIVAVTGEPGLFQLLSSKSDGAIIRSLDGQTTRFVPSRNHNFTPLESIEVFTTQENVSLADVFKAMHTREETLPVIDSTKDGKEIKKYFQAVFPTLDEERVYMSDMKKMLKWYPQLKANNLLQFEEETAEEKTEEQAPPVKETEKSETGDKPKEKATPQEKKATAKAGAAKGENKETGEAEKKKPGGTQKAKGSKKED